MTYALSAFSAANTKLNITRKATIQSSEGLRRLTLQTEGPPADEEESDKSNSTKIAALVALGALGFYFMQRSR